MKIAIVIGNRPHFVKAAPLIMVLNKYPDIETIIIHSGQHYDSQLSDAFLKDFNFPPVNENLSVGSRPIGEQTGMILSRLDPIYRKYQPDCVISMGDTNTTLAASLAAYQQHIPNAHIEAGMRENIWRPEEINKKVADHCADYLFAPIPRAADNLMKEGINAERIFLTGDITYDTFIINRESAIHHFQELKQQWEITIPDVYDLLTLHRAETVDDRSILEQILVALSEWPRPILFSVHPRTERRFAEFNLQTFWEHNAHVYKLPPLPYLDFLSLIQNAHTIATDSSGVLKEAFYARKPCIVVDDSTEYQEIFQTGAAVMGGRTAASLHDRIQYLDRTPYPESVPQLFGDGRAAVKMVEIIRSIPPFFQKRLFT